MLSYRYKSSASCVFVSSGVPVVFSSPSPATESEKEFSQYHILLKLQPENSVDPDQTFFVVVHGISLCLRR